MHFSDANRSDNEPLRSPREDEQLPPDTPAPLEPNGDEPLGSPRASEELPPKVGDQTPSEDTDEPLESPRD